MRNKINFPGLLFGVLFLVLSVFVSSAAANDHQITDVNLQPSPPAVLAPGERVEFTFQYQTTARSGVRIWGRPYHENKRAGGYRAHPSPVHSAQEGEGEGYFYFPDEQEVDKIRLHMVEAGTNDVLAEKFIDLNYSWRQDAGERSATEKISGMADSVTTRFLAGENLYEELKSDFSAADDSIRIYKIVYPFTEDEQSPARKLAELLVDRAEDGVNVQIMTSGSDHQFFTEDIEDARQFYKNTAVEFLNGEHEEERPGVEPSPQVVRGHSVLVDDEILYLGNFVLSDNDLSAPNSPGLRVTGPGIDPTVEQLDDIFRDHFGDPRGLWAESFPVQVEEFDLHLSENIINPLLEMIEGAEERIDLGLYRMSLLSNSRRQEIIEALVDAHRRGVKLNILLKQPDEREESEDVQYLLQRGVPVFLYDHPQQQYQRLMAVDDREVYLGSQKFNIELTGLGYGLSFTGKAPRLARQVRDYLDWWRDNSKKLKPEETVDRTEALEHLRSGELTKSHLADPEQKLGPLKLTETVKAEAQENFDPFTSRTLDGLWLEENHFALEFRYARGYEAENRINYNGRIWLPDYPTLFFDRLQAGSTISELEWVSAVDPETNEDVLRSDPGFFRRHRLKSPSWRRNSFRVDLNLTDLPDHLQLQGNYRYLIPAEVEGYLLSAEHFPWEVPGFNISARLEESEELVFQPFEDGRILGVVGFDTENSRVNASSRLDFRREEEPGLKINFHDPVDHLLVLVNRDFKVQQVPFVVETEIERRTFPAEEGYNFSLGAQKFELARLDYAPGADTTQTVIGSNSSERHLQGVLARDSEGNNISSRSWSWGGGGREWEFRQRNLWQGEVEEFKAFRFDNPQIKAGQFEVENGLLMDGETLRAKTMTEPEINYTVDTGPHHLRVTAHFEDIEESNLEPPLPVLLQPSLEDPKNRIFLNLFYEPLQVLTASEEPTVSFLIQGVGEPGWEKPHINGWNLSSFSGDQDQFFQHREDFTYSFDPLTLYEEERAADTDLNRLQINNIDLTGSMPEISFAIDYRSDHGQKMIVMAELGNEEEVEDRERWGDFFAVNLLTEPRQNVREEMTLRVDRDVQSLEETLAAAFDSATHLALRLYSFDQFDGPVTEPPEPVNEWIFELDELDRKK